MEAVALASLGMPFRLDLAAERRFRPSRLLAQPPAASVLVVYNTHLSDHTGEARERTLPSIGDLGTRAPRVPARQTQAGGRARNCTGAERSPLLEVGWG